MPSKLTSKRPRRNPDRRVAALAAELHALALDAAEDRQAGRGHAKLRGVGMLAVYLLCRASLTDESVLAAARGYALHRMADEVGGEREVIENVRFAADIPLSWAGVAQAAAEGLARHQVAREEREERLRAEEAERAEDDARAHEREMAAIDGAREERLRAEEEARLQLASSSSS